MAPSTSSASLNGLTHQQFSNESMLLSTSFSPIENSLEKPLFNIWQKIFIILRPGWLNEAKNYLTWQEFSGSLGDLGTFLPLSTALAVNKVNGIPQVSFGPVLFFAGIYTLLISTYFPIPMPIQPMKTITSVALINGNSHEQIVASGIIIGILMLLLTSFGGIHFLVKYTPISLVRGIQMGIGFGLVIKGFSSKYGYVHRREFIEGITDPKLTNDIVWFGIDSVFVSLLLGAFCLVYINRKVPTALLVFLYGIVISIYRYSTLYKVHIPLQFGPNWDGFIVPSWRDFSIALVELVLPQLPLTVLNSVIAVAALSKDLFPTRSISNTRAAVSLSVGNLAFCWFGMLPSCHGAGGLASQYAFGARSNVSMMFLGLLKVFIALLFGSTSLSLLQDGIFPASVLGVLLVFSGLNLCLIGMDVSTKEESIVMLITASASVALDTGVAFCLGCIAFMLLHIGTSSVLSH